VLRVSSIRYSVPEEKKIGSVVANVLKDLKLVKGDLSARRAQLVSKGTKQYFQLDTQSGNLLLHDKIDREALCGKIDPCLLLSEIVLQNPLKIYSIETLIEDVNDNNPEFSKNEFELEIPETVPANTRFLMDSAQDPDLGENSVQNYTLTSNEYFQLDVRKGKKNLDLVLVKQLDREKEAVLDLILTALDGGAPQRTGTVHININILDSNDNFPQFTQSEYKVMLRENSPQGFLISKVEATDSDFGSNAQIMYSFHRVHENILHLFHLNEITGEITVWGQIDYEKEISYEMDIKATDGGGLSGYCKVQVEIEDENDNAPELSIISLTSPLPEDSPLDTLVALFSITDRDSGDNGQTSCSADVSLPFLLKTTVNNYYQLVIQSPLDREKAPEYNVTITAIDRGSPRLSSTRVIHIQIQDVNDNSPVFEESTYQMALQENNIPGLLIGSVLAVDLDAEQNAKVTYSLLPGKVRDVSVASYISINSESGNVYILRSLDYEEIKHFQVTIRASDGGSPTLTSDATVHIVVIDENDNAPFLLYPLQNSTAPCNELVPRSAEAGYLVTKVVAVDEDSGQNSWLSFQLLKATDPALFSIGAQNGEVKTRRPLTERDPNKQRLVILVRDNGNPPQTSTTALNVLLVDSLSDPYRKNIEVGMEERGEEEEGPLTMYLVVCLAAVSFVFLVCMVVFVVVKMYKKGCSGSLIAVPPPHFPPARPEIPENGADSESGSLSRTYHYDVCLTGGSLCSEFRFLRPLIPVFSVGDPNVPLSQRVSSASQEIPDQVEGKETTAEQDAGTPLVVTLAFYEMHLRENNIPGLLMGSVHAVDLDTEKNARVTYSILPGKVSDGSVASYLSINSETGNLYVIQSLDYEEVTEFQAIVRATDGGSPSLSSEVIVQVHIMDENDNVPFVLYPLQNGTSPSNDLVPREAETGYLVTKVVAVDRDSGQNSWLSYELLKATEPGLFTVGAQNGEVKTMRPVHKRDAFKQKLIVGVRDNGHPPQSTSATLSILLVDGFSDPYMKMLDTPKEGIVEEEEEGRNLTVYLIVCLAAISFIFLVSVVVFVAMKIQKQRQFMGNYNTAPVFPGGPNFQENPVDSGSGPSSQAYNYEVCLAGGSLNSEFRFLRPLFPVFSVEPPNPQANPRNSTGSPQEVPGRAQENQQMNQLQENNLPGLLMGSVHAVDLDMDKNAKVAYSILPGKVADTSISAYLSINSETGNLYVLRSLDYEEIKEFQATVRASDGGSSPLSSEVIVRVLIVDENDNAPFVLYPLQNGTSPSNDLVPREAEAGYLVTKVVATDRDSGQNSWLSFELLKATEPGLFTVGAQNGEVKTMRPVNKRDMFKQKLIVGVRDNGHPPRSTSATLSILLVDGFSDPYMKMQDTPKGEAVEEEEDRNLTVYLIICLAAISFIFLVSVVVFIAVKIQKQKKFIGNYCSAPVFPGGPNMLENHVDSGSGPSSQAYNYEVCLGGGSLNSEFRFLRPLFPVFSVEPPNTQVNPRNSTDSSQEVPNCIIEESQPTNQRAIVTPETGEVYTLCSFDYEEIREIPFQVKAQDGGSPPLSSNVSVTLFILDQNDNTPEILYPSPPTDGSTGVELAPRSSEPGYLVTKVVAVDADSGQNGWLSYQLIKATEPGLFTVGLHTGEIRTTRFFLEKDALKQSLVILVKDNGQPPHSASVTVTVVLADSIPDILTDLSNVAVSADPQSDLTFYLVIAVAFVSCLFFTFLLSDNAPEILYASPPNDGSTGVELAPRSSEPGYLVTKVVAVDADFGQNGWLSYQLIKATEPGLFTVGLHTGEIRTVQETSLNYCSLQCPPGVVENAPAGVSIFTLKAKDPDAEENGKVTYSIMESEPSYSHFSSYLSINSETGVVHALRSFDYEEFREIHFQVRAQDGGSPPLSSNVSVTLFILDQNDNAPEILYPSPPTDGSTGVELAPRSSEPGYLVTKVVAVDADSGQNGWLSYQLIKATEPGLFTVGLHTGEIRTTRFFLEKDALKQSLVVLVKDNGQPPLSASVSVTVVLADSIPEILSDLSSISAPVEPQSDLTFYLVVAVAFVSCLFFTFLLVLLAIRLHKWRKSQLCDSGNVHINGVPVSQFVGIDGVRAFLQTYCHDVSLTSGSRKSQILFPIGSCTNTLTPQQAPDNLDPLLIIDDSSNIIRAEAAVCQNNQKGVSVCSLKADDSDWEENQRIVYSITEGQMNESPLSSYLSINSETGVVYALSSFDYEEFKEIQFHVKAQDGGSPPLSSNVSVTLFILDQNDNTPEILYPSPPTDGSTGVELAPRSSEPGYLVTKVVAVDADSGQNGWLSYQLIKATEPGLFTVGLHTGEIRTTRFFLEKDALKQSLVVLVKDNGQPPLCTSVTVTVVLADSIPAILSDLSSISAPVEPQSDLTFYLVVAVAFVSCLFFTFLLVLLAVRLYKWRNSQLCDSGIGTVHGVPVSPFMGIDGVRAFLHSYCHDVSLTMGSGKRQINFPERNCSNTMISQQQFVAQDHIPRSDDLNFGCEDPDLGQNLFCRIYQQDSLLTNYLYLNHLPNTISLRMNQLDPLLLFQVPRLLLIDLTNLRQCQQ
ncbi:hypothetical protein lerEdw1_020914, partial [Lerista edwardsae]